MMTRVIWCNLLAAGLAAFTSVVMTAAIAILLRV